MTGGLQFLDPFVCCKRKLQSANASTVFKQSLALHVLSFSLSVRSLSNICPHLFTFCLSFSSTTGSW